MTTTWIVLLAVWLLTTMIGVLENRRNIRRWRRAVKALDKAMDARFERLSSKRS